MLPSGLIAGSHIIQKLGQGRSNGFTPWSLVLLGMSQAIENNDCFVITSSSPCPAPQAPGKPLQVHNEAEQEWEFMGSHQDSLLTVCPVRQLRAPGRQQDSMLRGF